MASKTVLVLCLGYDLRRHRRCSGGVARGAEQLSEPTHPHHRARPCRRHRRTSSRAVTEQVGRDWKQTVVIESRPGGNSNIGTKAVARSELHGYVASHQPGGAGQTQRSTRTPDAGPPLKTLDAPSACGCGIRASHWISPIDARKAPTPSSYEIARKKPGELNSSIPVPALHRSERAETVSGLPASSSPMSVIKASRRRLKSI